MKKFKFNVFIIVFYLLASTGKSQSISPQVINSTGKTFQTSSFGMDINIGEPITGFISNGSFQITQGFLQPDVCDDNNPCVSRYRG